MALGIWGISGIGIPACFNGFDATRGYIPGITKSGAKIGFMPRVSKEERPLRDARILRLFLSGWSLREIGRHPQIQLSKHAVDLAIRRQLAADGSRRQMLSDDARQIYVLRTELLLSRLMPRALDAADPQQLKAWESCRRLLEQQARFYGLLGIRGADDDPGLPGSEPAPVLSLDEYRGRFRDERDPRPL